MTAAQSMLAHLDKEASILFFKGDEMYITKCINGQFITKQAKRDESYTGFRYDWIENLNSSK